MSTTIRVSEETRDRFSRLAADSGRPMTQLLDEAADALERRMFFDRLDARYSELQTDASAWAVVEEEREREDGAIEDRSV